MDLWRSAAGMVEVCLTSADTVAAMQAVNKAGIEIFSVRQADQLTVYFLLQRFDYRRLRRIMQSRGERIRLCRRRGMYWNFKAFLGRPVLLGGLVMMLFLTLYLPTKVLTIEVQGNVNVPSALILEKARLCGIDFWTQRSNIRSERMKNELLQAIPQLQWAGINTYGCRAVISVRERPVEKTVPVQPQISSIVAARDGIIRQITVSSGNKLCTVGQAVRTGQVLISGYTDCRICIRATRAEGDIIAQTRRSVTSVFPTEYMQKGDIFRQEKKYSLLIGKKQINFWKDSGISTTTCDKMYSVRYIQLPGGYRLPLALVTQTCSYYRTEETKTDAQAAQTLLNKLSDRYLVGTMTAGQIEQRTLFYSEQDGFCLLHGQYACLEMIGITRLEESLQYYGESD